MTSTHCPHSMTSRDRSRARRTLRLRRSRPRHRPRHTRGGGAYRPAHRGRRASSMPGTSARSTSATPTARRSSSPANLWRRDPDVARVRAVAALRAERPPDCSASSGCGSSTTRRCARRPAAATRRGTRTSTTGRSTRTGRSRCGCHSSMSAREVGSMTFVTGSHRLGDLCGGSISDESDAEFERSSTTANCPTHTYGAVNAGDATFHAGWTVHSAGPNPTNQMRTVMTVIYFADGARVLPHIDAGPGVRPAGVAEGRARRPRRFGSESDRRLGRGASWRRCP